MYLQLLVNCNLSKKKIKQCLVYDEYIVILYFPLVFIKFGLLNCLILHAGRKNIDKNIFESLFEISLEIF
jgi:hypothetical protein